jgi:hypothetical protein
MQMDISPRPKVRLQPQDVGGQPFPLAQLGSGRRAMHFIMARVVSGTIALQKGWYPGGLPTLAECRMAGVRLTLLGQQLLSQSGQALLDETALPSNRQLDLKKISLLINNHPVDLGPGVVGLNGKPQSVFQWRAQPADQTTANKVVVFPMIKPIIDLLPEDINGVLFPLAPMAIQQDQTSPSMVWAKVSYGDIVLDQVTEIANDVSPPYRMNCAIDFLNQGSLIIPTGQNLLKQNYIALKIIDPDKVVVCMNGWPITLQSAPRRTDQVGTTSTIILTDLKQ